jgi:hypothetical protein
MLRCVGLGKVGLNEVVKCCVRLGSSCGTGLCWVILGWVRLNQARLWGGGKLS